MSVLSEPATVPGSAPDDPSGHKPYIPDQTVMKEFTLSALIVGASLGIIFAASSLYLVLKLGMTVSASIPVSVLAITLFRFFSKITGLRRATILENNIVQTTGSAGESIAFGVGVSMPALLILGFEMDITRVMVVSILGGILGILAMIPLRRAFIVKMHGRPGEPGALVYPEGTACAQVLIAGEKGGSTGVAVFAGFGIAFLHKFITEGLNVLVTTVKLPLGFINRAATFSGEMASELIGVGYIIGLRTSAIMMSGAVLGYLILIPLIAYVGDSVTDQPVAPGTKLISEMSVKELRDNYLLFIGAGCVATAGIISMFRTLPMIVKSIGSGLSTMRQGTGGNGGGAVKRTEYDMPMSVVFGGSFLLIVLLALFMMGEVGVVSAVLGALLVIVFGFLFVTVSTRLTGEIGSSSNPISGMTVATLTLTCLIFLALDWTSSSERVLALSIAAVVCVAASNGGTTAQSLKTGFLVGATPRWNQYAILIGAVTSALVIGFTLVLGFNKAGTVYSEKAENLANVTLTQSQMAQVPDREMYKGKEYIVWDTRRDYNFVEPLPANIKTGRYLVDPETGKPKWLVDPGIMGKLEERDDGSKVKREFDAPKTQVMGLIIDGVLSQKLNWTLVLIGALIAIVLELCGVSALAFAVGLYVPIQYSTPIFIGGVLRWCVDRYLAWQHQGQIDAVADDPVAKAQAEIEAIRKSETSPGVLLAAGYIAGGSLAGMLLAFTNFSDSLPSFLSQWQYSTVTVGDTEPFEKWVDDVAPVEQGMSVQFAFLSKEKSLTKYKEELEELNEDTLISLAPIKAKTKVKIPKQDAPYEVSADITLEQLAEEVSKKFEVEISAKKLFKLNREVLIPYVPVPKGTALRLPDYSFYTTEKDATLGEVAETVLKDRDKAQALWDKNKSQKDKDGKKILQLSKAKDPSGITVIEPASTVPAGTKLKLPQKDWPALLVFTVLAGVLLAVGTGKLMKSDDDTDEKPRSPEPRPAPTLTQRDDGAGMQRPKDGVERPEM